MPGHPRIAHRTAQRVHVRRRHVQNQKPRFLRNAQQLHHFVELLTGPAAGTAGSSTGSPRRWSHDPTEQQGRRGAYGSDNSASTLVPKHLDTEGQLLFQPATPTGSSAGLLDVPDAAPFNAKRRSGSPSRQPAVGVHQVLSGCSGHLVRNRSFSGVMEVVGSSSLSDEPGNSRILESFFLARYFSSASSEDAKHCRRQANLLHNPFTRPRHDEQGPVPRQAVHFTLVNAFDRNPNKKHKAGGAF